MSQTRFAPAEGNPSPPFRGEREGPIAQRWEGEVGLDERSGIPHLTPALSAPRGGKGAAVDLRSGLSSSDSGDSGGWLSAMGSSNSSRLGESLACGGLEAARAGAYLT